MKPLAALDGAPLKTVPYSVGDRFGKLEEDVAVAAIRSQKLWYLGGTRVFEAERIIRQMYGIEHAVLCSSGTAAIHFRPGCAGNSRGY